MNTLLLGVFLVVASFFLYIDTGSELAKLNQGTGIGQAIAGQAGAQIERSIMELDTNYRARQQQASFLHNVSLAVLVGGSVITVAGFVQLASRKNEP